MNLPVTDCRRLADEVEADARLIGDDWKGRNAICRASAEFRRACDAIAGNRGFDVTTIAFVGPKNAGKTLLLTLLVKNESCRAQLHSGVDAAHATERPVWLATTPPEGWRRNDEHFIPLAPEEFESLGFPYVLLDVPGNDERHPEREMTAVHALDDARIKVLVVNRALIEAENWAAYVAGSDGACIVPIISWARDLPPSDIAGFSDKLANHLPRSLVTAPIIVEDFDLPGKDRDVILVQAKDALRHRLMEAAARRHFTASATEQLAVRQERFRKEIAEVTAKHLPATSHGLGSLAEELGKLPERAVRVLLGDERRIAANVRGGLRAMLLERTPVWLFPWRLSMSLANLVHGATDRLPLAVLGSLPSLLTVGWHTAKNVRQGRQFRREMEEGLRRRIEETLRDEISDKLHSLGRNLDADLQRKEPAALPSEKYTVHLVGLESLQAVSTEIFKKQIEEHSPNHCAARCLGVAGFVVFWLIFGQPLWGLYHDFFSAASEVLASKATALAAFPANTFSMLATSALLAFLPMAFLLLITFAVVARRKQVDRCIEALRSAHNKKIEELAVKKQLRVELSEPRIDACRRLLAGGACT